MDENVGAAAGRFYHVTSLHLTHKFIVTIVTTLSKSTIRKAFTPAQFHRHECDTLRGE
jgi:hypothetical protein